MHDAEYRRIAVSSPQGPVWALVDLEDFERFGSRRWHLSNGYVTRHQPMVNGSRKKIVLHREILGLQRGDGLEGDHINRDRLDNRRSNLRTVTRAVNGRNIPSHGGASRYRGVRWNKGRGKWEAGAVFSGKRNYLGLYTDEDAAARAVNAFWVGRDCYAPNDVSGDASAVAGPSS